MVIISYYCKRAHLMEERDFLHEICLTVLAASKNVIFVGVVNSNGKLIVGEHRRQNMQWPLLIKSNFANNELKINRFYSNCLNPAIKREFDPAHRNNNTVDFKLIEFDNAKIAITPLTERNDRYLCVHIKSSVSSYQQIISKICNTI